MLKGNKEYLGNGKEGYTEMAEMVQSVKAFKKYEKNEILEREPSIRKKKIVKNYTSS